MKITTLIKKSALTLARAVLNFEEEGLAPAFSLPMATPNSNSVYRSFAMTARGQKHKAHKEEVRYAHYGRDEKRIAERYIHCAAGHEKQNHRQEHPRNGSRDSRDFLFFFRGHEMSMRRK